MRCKERNRCDEVGCCTCSGDRLKLTQLGTLQGKPMSKSLQYITNQQGERVGVLLDLETYDQLTTRSVADVELLADLSREELQALAESSLASASQAQLDELLDRNAKNQLTVDSKAVASLRASEVVVLDRLLAQVDQLNIIKTRARYTLKHLEGTSTVA